MKRKRVTSKTEHRRSVEQQQILPLSTGWILLLLTGTFFLLDPRIRDPFLSVRQLFLSLAALGLLYGIFIRGRKVVSLDRPWGILTLVFSISFLAWSLLSATQSDNVAESLQLITREGLFVILLLLLTGLLAPARQVMPLLTRTVAIVLLLQALTGILQQSGLGMTGLPGLPQPVGFSGNRNLFGSLLVLQMPLTIWVWWRDQRPWKILAAAALVAALVALLFSQTRSAWLAFLAGIACADLLLLTRARLFSPSARRTLRLAHVAGVSLIVLAAGSMASGLFGQQLSNSLKDRFQSLYQPSAVADRVAGRNMEERRFVWTHTAEMIRDHPVLGVGPGNWRIRFPLYGGASSMDVSEIDKLRVQPHNIYLQIASETGVPGLLLFLLAGLSPVLAILSSLRRKDLDEETTGTLLLLLAGLTSLAVDMMFSFPLERAEHTLMAMIYLALGLTVSRPAPSSKTAPVHVASLPLVPAVFPRYLVPQALGLACSVLLAFSAFLSWEKWRVDYYIVECIKKDGEGNPSEVIRLAERGKSAWVTLGPVNDPLELFAGRAYNQLGQPEEALKVLQQALRFHPNNHRIFNTIGYAFISAGKWQEALEPLKKALSLSPDYEPALVNLALCYYQLADYDRCMALRNKIKLDDKPDLEDFFRKVELQKHLKALQANPFYSAVLFVQKQIDEGQRRINIEPMFQVREKVGSDSAFIDAYFDFAGQYLAFNLRTAEQSSSSSEALEQLLQRCRSAKKFCQDNFPPQAVVDRIFTSNHRLMAEKFTTDTSENWKTLDDIFIPVR